MISERHRAKKRKKQEMCALALKRVIDFARFCPLLRKHVVGWFLGHRNYALAFLRTGREVSKV